MRLWTQEIDDNHTKNPSFKPPAPVLWLSSAPCGRSQWGLNKVFTMAMDGWIKLHRKIQRWEWYTDSNMVHLFIHLILSANHEDGKWHGVEVKKGQVVTGRKSLSQATGISEQTIRTCLERLKSTSEITIQPTNRFSVISVVNYKDYQFPTDASNQPTNQPTNQQLTTNKNVKNIKNNPPTPQKSSDRDFEVWWNEYPRKVGKRTALAAWKKVNGERIPLPDMLKVLAAQKASAQWNKDRGQYIPHPTTYLNQGRWNDDTEIEYKNRPSKEVSLDQISNLFGDLNDGK